MKELAKKVLRSKIPPEISSNCVSLGKAEYTVKVRICPNIYSLYALQELRYRGGSYKKTLVRIRIYIAWCNWHAQVNNNKTKLSNCSTKVPRPQINRCLLTERWQRKKSYQCTSQFKSITKDWSACLLQEEMLLNYHHSDYLFYFCLFQNECPDYSLLLCLWSVQFK